MKHLSLPLLLAVALGTAPLAVAQSTRGIAFLDSIQAATPAFEAYPAGTPWHGRPVPPNLASQPWARTFRTVLREAAKAGPNFAGHFTVVHWGCGSSCQIQAVLDARTGHVFPQRLQTTMGASYRLDSDLLLADPVSAIREAFGDDTAVYRCVVCGTPAAYRWVQDHFVAVGPGDHPHWVRE